MRILKIVSLFIGFGIMAPIDVQSEIGTTGRNATVRERAKISYDGDGIKSDSSIRQKRDR